MPTSLSAEIGNAGRPRHLLLVTTLPASAVLASLIDDWLWPDQVTKLLASVDHTERTPGTAGWGIAPLVQVLIALCGIVPASIGAISDGIIYRTPVGFIVCGPATLAGAAVAFMLSRSLFRDAIARAVPCSPRMRRLDKAVSRDAWIRLPSFAPDPDRACGDD